MCDLIPVSLSLSTAMSSKLVCCVVYLADCVLSYCWFVTLPLSVLGRSREEEEEEEEKERSKFSMLSTVRTCVLQALLPPVCIVLGPVDCVLRCFTPYMC